VNAKETRILRAIVDACVTIGGFVLFPPALAFSIVASEFRLWIHVGTHQAPPETPAGQAIARRTSAAVYRVLAVAGFFGLGVLAIVTAYFLLVGLHVETFIESFIKQYPEYAMELLFLQVFAVFQLAVTVPYVGYLHLFRGAVRRHEELFAPLEQPDADAWLGHARDDWSRRYVQDVLLSFLCALPLVGLFMVVVLAVRFTGTLERHEERERPGTKLELA